MGKQAFGENLKFRVNSEDRIPMYHLFSFCDLAFAVATFYDAAINARIYLKGATLVDNHTSFTHYRDASRSLA